MGKNKLYKATITVSGSEIAVTSTGENENDDFISLTDMTKNFEGGSTLIEQWVRNKDTIIFLGTWEKYIIQILIPPNSRELKMKLEQVATIYQ